jgi:signal transduction histidine kinase
MQLLDSQKWYLNRFDFETKEYLNAIKMSGDALIVLINDILDLAKVVQVKCLLKTPLR